MFNTGLIDSLRLRVKMENINVIDKRIITEYVPYYPTLDALDGDTQSCYDEELKKAPPYTRIIHGITYRFFVKGFINSKGYAEQYMVFQISAKMCKHKYFQGITAANFPDIVKDINKLGVIKVSERHMLEGLVSDIDICINQLIDEKSLRAAFALIRQFAMPGKQPLLHFISSSTNKGKNLGVDFNKREKATNSVPYCKIYHKGFELQTKSSEFYRQFLEPMRSAVLDNLVRYEFTIKAHKHKEYLAEKGYNSTFKTMKELLNATSEELRSIAMSGLPMYLEPRTRKKRDNEGLTPQQIKELFFIENLIKLGFDEEKLLGFTYDIDCPVARSRQKSATKKLIKEQITAKNSKLNERMLQNSRTNNFLSNLGFAIA